MQQAEADTIRLMELNLMAYDTNNLTRKAASDLIYGGLVFQDISGFHNLTQLDCSKKILEAYAYNETRLNATFGPYISCNDFPISPKHILESLIILIPKLPHDSTATHDMTFYLVSSILALLVLGTRIWVRRFKAPKVLHAEDYLASASMVFNILTAVFLQLTPSNHVYDFTWHGLKMWGITIYTAYQMFFFGHILIKWSFLAFYYRLNPEKFYRRSVIAVGIVVTMFSLTGWLITTLQCMPANSMWLHPFKVRTCIPDKKCINRIAAFIVSGSLIIISDLMILILPIPMVWRMLNLHKREKIAISCMFGAGLFITTFSILRVRTLKPWLTSNDFPSKVSGQEVWMIMELDISVIISCLPALKPVLFPKRKPSDVIISFMKTFAANIGGKGGKGRPKRRSIFGLTTTMHTTGVDRGETGDFQETTAMSNTVASMDHKPGSKRRVKSDGDLVFKTIHGVGPMGEEKDYQNHDPWLADFSAEKHGTVTSENQEEDFSAALARERETSHGTVDTIEPIAEPTRLQAPSAAHIKSSSGSRPRPSVGFAPLPNRNDSEDSDRKRGSSILAGIFGRNMSNFSTRTASSGVLPVDEFRSRNSSARTASSGVLPIDEFRDRSSSARTASSGVLPMDEFRDRSSSARTASSGVLPMDPFRARNSSSRTASSGVLPMDAFRTRNSSARTASSGVIPSGGFRIRSLDGTSTAGIPSNLRHESLDPDAPNNESPPNASPRPSAGGSPTKGSPRHSTEVTPENGSPHSGSVEGSLDKIVEKGSDNNV